MLYSLFRIFTHQLVVVRISAFNGFVRFLHLHLAELLQVIVVDALKGCVDFFFGKENLNTDLQRLHKSHYVSLHHQNLHQ